METYERIFADYDRAKEIQKLTNGTLDEMQILDSNGNPITDAGEIVTVYRVRYKQ